MSITTNQQISTDYAWIRGNPLGILLYWPYCGLRFSGFPIASKKMALLPFA